MGLKEIKGDWREDDDAVLGREKSLYQLKNKVDNNNRGQQGQSRGNRRQESKKKKKKKTTKTTKTQQKKMDNDKNGQWGSGGEKEREKCTQKHRI